MKANAGGRNEKDGLRISQQWLRKPSGELEVVRRTCLKRRWTSGERTVYVR